MRERGNIWPIICVVTVALLVLVLPLVVRHRQTNGRMATVDAQVSIGDASSDPISNHDPPAYRWPEGEETRTAERLEEVAADGIPPGTSVVQGALPVRTRHDAGEMSTSYPWRQ